MSNWSEAFQRLVLALALRGDLLSRFPGMITAQLFTAGQMRSPQARIAGVLADYWVKYSSRPTPESVDQLVRQETLRLGEVERRAVEQEWVWVAETELPEDPRFVYDQVREWSDYRRLETALLRGSELLSQGPTSIAQVRELLSTASAPLATSDDRLTFYSYLNIEPRLAAWRSGEEQGQRIPSGLPALDRALGGGPTRKEVMYFLAPPKGAKTASLLRVAQGALRRRFGVYLVTYEMQAMRMMLRADRMLTRSTREELRESTTNLERAIEGIRLGAVNMWIEESTPERRGCVSDAARRIEKIRREGGIVDLVVLDYLNIMGAYKTEKEKRHELTKVSREIAQLAKEMNVLVWTAALVNRQATMKRVVRKTDIAEAYEVVAVSDGMIAICATKAMLAQGYRRYWVAAGREYQDEVLAGDYAVDFDRMSIDPANSQDVDTLLSNEQDRASQPRTGGDQ